MSKVRIALGIRAQLLLVLTVFLAIPWLGYEYVRELERFLRDAQEKTLAGTAQAVEETLERGKLKLDLKRLAAHWDGKRVDLTLTEFWMVHTLARFPGHVKDRDSLMRDAKIVVDDATITSHIKRIRRKFLVLDPAFDCIDTVYGMGYRWNAETER